MFWIDHSMLPRDVFTPGGFWKALRVSGLQNRSMSDADLLLRRDLVSLMKFFFKSLIAVFNVVFLLIPLMVHAAGAKPAAYAAQVEQWGMQEISLRSSIAYNNPFSEVQLQAEFTSEGKSILVKGFYDGDRTWRVRFMPETRGHWTFKTTSNDADLNHQQGQFTVGQASSENHGPVRVAKTYHFSYADGKPYFLLGTTLYNWLNRDDHLQEQTLHTLSESPFTKVRFGLFPKWYVYNRVEPTMYPYVETARLKFDLDRFNPAFFQHVEKRIADLQRRGIEADIILFHPYDHAGFAKMEPAQDDAYIRYVAARLSAYRNVWWTMANEYDLFDPAMTPGQKTKDWNRMFQVLQESDPYSHPRGIHNIADWYDHSKPWITHVIIQDGTGSPARRLPAARAKYAKPLVVDEYGYEGNNGQGWGSLSGEEEVSRHWDITMAGGYASHGETYVHPDGVLWWAAGGTLVGESEARLGFLRKIMTSAPFQDLVPAPEIVKGGTALALKGSYYLLRIKNTPLIPGQSTEIELEGDGAYQVDLIDPWLMKVYKLGYTRSGLQAFRPFMMPCLFRFTKVEETQSVKVSENVQQLIADFVQDPTIAKPPPTTKLEVKLEYFSSDFTLGELLADERTKALLDQYLPGITKKGLIRILTLDQFAQYVTSDSSAEKLASLRVALKKIPLKPE
jgi:hypothetical protein